MMFNQLFVIYKQTCCQHTHTRLNIQTLLALFYVIKERQRGREGESNPKQAKQMKLYFWLRQVQWGKQNSLGKLDELLVFNEQRTLIITLIIRVHGAL